jgi:hypothetical protein
MAAVVPPGDHADPAIGFQHDGSDGCRGAAPISPPASFQVGRRRLAAGIRRGVPRM